MVERGALKELVAQELIRGHDIGSGAFTWGRPLGERARWPLMAIVMAIVMAINKCFEPAHVKTSLFEAGGMLTEYRPRSSFAALTYD